jgi:hypothetical protein
MHVYAGRFLQNLVAMVTAGARRIRRPATRGGPRMRSSGHAVCSTRGAARAAWPASTCQTYVWAEEVGVVVARTKRASPNCGKVCVGVGNACVRRGHRFKTCQAQGGGT